MEEDSIRFAFVALSAVFFVIDPIANVPIFLTITAGDSSEARRGTAWRAALAAWLTLSVFALAGGVIFRLFGISFSAFKIAGGLMLLLMSVDMMRAQTSPTRPPDEQRGEARERDAVAIFPLAIPMLAGPGAIATVTVLMSRAAWHVARTAAVLVAVTLSCVAAWLLMRSASRAERFLPKTLLRALERIMGLLLAAVAV